MIERKYHTRTIPKSTSIDGWHSRGYLPHFDEEELTQSICFRLHDSMPRVVIDKWLFEMKQNLKKEIDIEMKYRIDAYLDKGVGNCYLRNPKIAGIVQSTLLFFDGEKYLLHAWCIMPNHVHALLSPINGFDLGKITHSWKSFTAHSCNKILNRSGSFWQRDVYDRYIRNERHFKKAVEYIEMNPVKAHLCVIPEDWLWSSASLGECENLEVPTP